MIRVDGVPSRAVGGKIGIKALLTLTAAWCTLWQSSLSPNPLCVTPYTDYLTAGDCSAVPITAG